MEHHAETFGNARVPLFVAWALMRTDPSNLIRRKGSAIQFVIVNGANPAVRQNGVDNFLNAVIILAFSQRSNVRRPLKKRRSLSQSQKNKHSCLSHLHLSSNQKLLNHNQIHNRKMRIKKHKNNNLTPKIKILMKQKTI